MIEVAIGVEFVPLPALGVVALVGLRDRWRGDFPKVQELQPLISGVQPGIMIQGFGLEIGHGGPAIRLWMISEDDSTLLQAQNDRLVLNWRLMDGSGDEAAYPRYETLRPLFEQRLTDLFAYLAEQAYGVPQPTVAEVTFVNGVDGPSGSHELAGVLSTVQHADLPGQLIQSRMQLVLDVAAEVGTQGHAVITAEPRDEGFISLTVATKLALAAQSDGIDQVMSALDKAHAVGVNTFTAVTDASMHKKWGRLA